MLERARVITLYTTGNEVQVLKVKVEEKLQHIYLDKYIQKPKVDEEKIRLLLTILNSASLSKERKECYIIATMLVQVALEIHDWIPNDNKNQMKQTTKKNQLNILAGDYFSGLYYLLLSETNDISFIHTLAKAIKEVNERKMTYYHQTFSNTRECLDTIQELESLIILRVASYVNKNTLNRVIKEWLLLNRLKKEIRLLKEEKVSNSINDELLLSYKCGLSIRELENQLQKQMEITKDLYTDISDAYSDLKIHIGTNLR